MPGDASPRSSTRISEGLTEGALDELVLNDLEVGASLAYFRSLGLVAAPDVPPWAAAALHIMARACPVRRPAMTPSSLLLRLKTV